MRNGLQARVRHERRVSVLVVEDDATLRGELALRLVEEGYTVETAADGQAAIECLQSGCVPSIMIVDLEMPRRDGGEVLAEMEREPRWADIPVVVVTGATYGLLAETLRLGGMNVLAKPFEIQHLLAHVSLHATV
jgi:CheY-like chemotaxis protein